jgi:hypothetical protein
VSERVQLTVDRSSVRDLRKEAEDIVEAVTRQQQAEKTS